MNGIWNDLCINEIDKQSLIKSRFFFVEYHMETQQDCLSTNVSSDFIVVVIDEEVWICGQKREASETIKPCKSSLKALIYFGHPDIMHIHRCRLSTKCDKKKSFTLLNSCHTFVFYDLNEQVYPVNMCERARGLQPLTFLFIIISLLVRASAKTLQK